MIGLAIAVAAGAGEASKLNALPLAAFGGPYAFAAFVSMRPLESRESLLKATVVVSLVLAVVGAVLFGPELPVVLTPAIALLAQAAGLIFQGKR